MPPVNTFEKFQTALQQFRKVSGDMLAVTDTYTPELAEKSEACGWWSPKQIIAHEAGWLVELHRRYDLFAAGNVEPIEYDFDTFNAQSVEARAHLDWPGTLSEFRDLIARTISRAESLTAQQAGGIKGYGGWLDAMSEDMETHTHQLSEFKKLQG
ncbi:MAG: hypothetical protein IPO91_06495 [Chloroflexi bacterium]|jgi:hypothetical protein|uniref:hypothetical protein n=1 Tax=Candidatus Flexifilum breve TaxID=3140694 RepID=UPI003135AE3F|nr:hypothetical protein [Chloroflexota bacterium]MBK9746415.1 hypothetical protein [Chloroflexota bacterium]